MHACESGSKIVLEKQQKCYCRGKNERESEVNEIVTTAGSCLWP